MNSVILFVKNTLYFHIVRFIQGNYCREDSLYFSFPLILVLQRAGEERVGVGLGRVKYKKRFKVLYNLSFIFSSVLQIPVLWFDKNSHQK
jgi:hypothetical protein